MQPSGVEFRHDVLGLVRVVAHPFAYGFVEYVAIEVCSQRHCAILQFGLNYLILIVERGANNIGVDLDVALVLVDECNQHVERCLSI